MFAMLHVVLVIQQVRKWRNDYDALQKKTTFTLTSYDTMEALDGLEREVLGRFVETL